MAGQNELLNDGVTPDQRGRCRTCGYLAQRVLDAALEPALHEVSEAQRDTFTGELVLAGRGVTSTVPHCFVRAADLEREYGTPLNRARQAQLVLDRDRRCPRWSAYVPGFSPKEHLAYARAQQDDLERKRYQERQEESRRQFELALQRDSRRFQVKVTIALIVLVLVASVLPFALARLLK